MLSKTKRKKFLSGGFSELIESLREYMYSSVWSEKDLLRIATSGISTLGLILCGIFSN